MFNDIGVVVLCGGMSSRMGYPKPFLKICGRTLLERIIETYVNAGITRPVIVMNAELFNEDQYKEIIKKVSEKALIIKNSNTVLGRSYSIHLGLDQMRKKSCCFIQNIDNPDFSSELIREMMMENDAKSYVVPSYHGKTGHPVLIGKKIIDHLLSFGNSDWILKDELKNFKRKSVATTINNVLLNVNTYENYHSYLSSLSQISSVDKGEKFI